MNYLYRNVALSILFLCTISQAMEPAHSPVPPAQVFNSDGKPSSALVQLLHAFGITAETSQEIVKETQAKWLRTPGKERWEAEDPYASFKEELMPLFKQFGAISEIKPLKKEYDYVLIMGGLYRRVVSRMNYAAQLWQDGVRYKEIVALGSERELNPELEPVSHFFDFSYQTPLSEIPKTEYDMMQYVYANTRMAVEMENIKTTFINAPNTIANGKTKRANTQDTLTEWLKSNPKPGSCLIISNQPHIDYQKSVARTVLPESFIIDAAGDECDANSKVNEILDAIARVIYQESLLLEKNKLTVRPE